MNVEQCRFPRLDVFLERLAKGAAPDRLSHRDVIVEHGLDLVDARKESNAVPMLDAELKRNPIILHIGHSILQ